MSYFGFLLQLAWNMGETLQQLTCLDYHFRFTRLVVGVAHKISSSQMLCSVCSQVYLLSWLVFIGEREVQEEELCLLFSFVVLCVTGSLIPPASFVFSLHFIVSKGQFPHPNYHLFLKTILFPMQPPCILRTLLSPFPVLNALNHQLCFSVVSHLRQMFLLRVILVQS